MFCDTSVTALPVAYGILQHNVDTEQEDSDAGKDAAMGLLWDIAPSKERGAEDHGVSEDR